MKKAAYNPESPTHLFETFEFLAYSKWYNKALVG